MNPNVTWIETCYECGRNIESKRPIVRQMLNRLTVGHVRKDYLAGLLPRNTALLILRENLESKAAVEKILDGLPEDQVQDINTVWLSNFIKLWYKIILAHQFLSQRVPEYDLRRIFIGNLQLVRETIEGPLPLRMIRNFHQMNLINADQWSKLTLTIAEKARE